MTTKKLTIEFFIVGGNISAAIEILDAAGIYNQKIENILRFDGIRLNPCSRAIKAACGIFCEAEYKSLVKTKFICQDPTNTDRVLIAK